MKGFNLFSFSLYFLLFSSKTSSVLLYDGCNTVAKEQYSSEALPFQELVSDFGISLKGKEAVRNTKTAWTVSYVLDIAYDFSFNDNWELNLLGIYGEVINSLDNNSTVIITKKGATSKIYFNSTIVPLKKDNRLCVPEFYLQIKLFKLFFPNMKLFVGCGSGAIGPQYCWDTNETVSTFSSADISTVYPSYTETISNPALSGITTLTDFSSFTHSLTSTYISSSYLSSTLSTHYGTTLYSFTTNNSTLSSVIYITNVSSTRYLNYSGTIPFTTSDPSSSFFWSNWPNSSYIYNTTVISSSPTITSFNSSFPSWISTINSSIYKTANSTISTSSFRNYTSSSSFNNTITTIPISTNYTTSFPSLSIPTNYTTSLPSLSIPTNYTTSFPTLSFSTNYTTSFPSLSIPTNYTTSFPTLSFSTNYTTSFPSLSIPTNYTTSFPTLSFPTNYTTSFPTLSFPTNYTTSFPIIINTTFSLSISSWFNKTSTLSNSIPNNKTITSFTFTNTTTIPSTTVEVSSTIPTWNITNPSTISTTLPTIPSSTSSHTNTELSSSSISSLNPIYTPTPSCSNIKFAKGTPEGNITAVSAQHLYGDLYNVTYHIQIFAEEVTNDDLWEVRVDAPSRRWLFSYQVYPPGPFKRVNWFDYYLSQVITVQYNVNYACAPPTSIHYDWNGELYNSFDYRTGCDSGAVSPLYCWRI